MNLKTRRKLLPWRQLLSLWLAVLLTAALLQGAALAVEEPAALAALTIRTGTSTADNANALLTGANQDGVAVFASGTRSYTLPCGTLTDTSTQLRFWYETEEAGATVTLRWGEGASDSKVLSTASDGTALSNKWANCLHAGRNTLTLTVTPPASSGKTEGVYTFTIDLKPTLTGLRLTSDGKEVYLDADFAAGKTTYSADIASNAYALEVDAAPRSAETVLSYNGQPDSTVYLDAADSVVIGLQLGEVTNQYTVTLHKLTAFDATVNATPADATVVFYDAKGATIARGTGTATASGMISGSYVVTAKGYVAKTAALTGGTTDVALTQAPAPATPLPTYTGDWTSFRGNENNMGVTAAQTPTLSAQAELKWAVKLGTGFAAAPTPPIILNGELYVYSNKKLFRLDKATGATLAQSGDLAGAAGFATNPIVYGDGMLFIQIGKGRIQALRADTLESLWISEAVDDNQTISPITYHNGYVYTGTWGRESEDGAYFCLSVTDEDPTKPDEVKLCTWKRTHLGGFYWAGAYATDNYVIFGSDDGTSEGDFSANGILYSVNAATGELIDAITGIRGDIRSTVSYDPGTGCVYCTTKGGLLIKVKVNADGSFDRASYQTTELGGMSTGTPLVYHGVLFVGMCGPSQFSGTGHYFKVFDAADLTQLSQVASLGYVQTSSLLTTGYQAENGKIYIYYTYNQNPGGIYVMEYDLAARTGGSSELFVPEKSMQNYCICSLVCDSDGTIYYKNDSCYLMAVRKTKAWATGITYQAGDAEAIAVADFSPSTLAYELVVPRGTQSVTVSALGSAGSAVRVGGSPDSAAIDLSSGSAETSVRIENGGDVREYTLRIRWASNDTTVNILLSTSNSCSGSMAVLEGNTYLLTNAASITNIWLGAKNGNTVDSFALIGENTPSFTTKTSGNVNGGNTYQGYYRDSAFTFPVKAKLQVTAEDGVTKGVYYLVVTKDAAYTPDTLDKVYVTIADKGSVAIAQKPVTVKDRNCDGKFDVDEALYAAHEAYYPGGAAAGYATASSQFGLGITKLWGDTSSNFGYFLDHAMCMSPEDPVIAGQQLDAFVTIGAYPDNEPYAWLDQQSYSTKAGSGLLVTLKAQNGYDESWQPIFAAYAGAQLLAYDSAFSPLAANAYSVTDKGEGVYAVTFQSAGSYYLAASAQSTGDAAKPLLVPAVAAVTVSEADPPVEPETKLRVSFRLIGAAEAKQDVDLSSSKYLPSYVTWIKTTPYQLDQNATVYDLFMQALRDAGLRQIGADKNYVETIFAPSGYELSEFTNGKYSGWMYTINGSHPGYGLKEQALHDGDVVIWHYINDYRHEVQDWFDDADYPALGDGSYWGGWLKAPDYVGGQTAEQTDGSGSGGSTGGSSGTTEDPGTETNVPATTVKTETKVENGKATAAVSKEDTAKALEAAKTENQEAVTISAVTEEAVNEVRVTVPEDALRDIGSAGKAVTVESNVGSLTLDAAALLAVGAAEGEEVAITLETVSAADAQELAKTADGWTEADVADAVTVKLSVQAGDKRVTSFGGGKVTVDIPVDDTYAEGESYKVLVVSDDGTSQLMAAKIVLKNGKPVAQLSLTHLTAFVVTRLPAINFADVKKGDWYYDAVVYASVNGLFSGVSEDAFAPKDQMTRAMLAVVLYRMAGSPVVTGACAFNDVQSGAWYSSAVLWASQNGIVNGLDNGSFGVGQKVTRQQMAAMLLRYAAYKGYDTLAAAADLSAFADANEVASWAEEAFIWANAKGLITGRTETTLAPDGTATRAEVATILQRFTDNVK